MNKKSSLSPSSNTISVITKFHGAFKTDIDPELQKTNPLAARGIFLVEVSEGVVWGYDSRQYIYDESSQIIRRTFHATSPTLTSKKLSHDSPQAQVIREKNERFME